MIRETRRRRVFSGLAACLLLSLASVSATAAPPTIFAAASLKNALDDAVAAFARAGGGPVSVSYGASSTLAHQIEQGAPAAVFISADARWMDYLAARGAIDRGSRVDLFTNHLALIAPAGSPVRLRIGKGMALAAALRGGRLAIAGPEVPAGRYARASLTALGVFDSVKDSLAPAENVRAALAFVAQGAAPLGVAYDTDARVEPKVRIVGLFPNTSHPPIVYPAALVGRRPDPAAAKFLRFLQGPRAARIFTVYGFRRLK